MADVIESPEASTAPEQTVPKKNRRRQPRSDSAAPQDSGDAANAAPKATPSAAPTAPAAQSNEAAANRPHEQRRQNNTGPRQEPWYVRREKDRLKRLESQSMPFRTSSITLKTRHAQEAYERASEMWTEAMITLSVTMRSFKDEPDCIVVDKQVDSYMDECDEAIRKEKQRLLTVGETNGLNLEEDGEVEYTNIQQYKLRISSPRERRFHNALLELDKVCTYMDMLWMAGFATDRARSVSAYELKSRILRTCGRARTLVFRAQGSSQRSGAQVAQDPRKGTALDPNKRPNETNEPGGSSTSPVIAEPATAELAVA